MNRKGKGTIRWWEIWTTKRKLNRTILMDYKMTKRGYTSSWARNTLSNFCVTKLKRSSLSAISMNNNKRNMTSVVYVWKTSNKMKRTTLINKSCLLVIIFIRSVNATTYSTSTVSENGSKKILYSCNVPSAKLSSILHNLAQATSHDITYKYTTLF